jgi:porin
MSRLIALPSAAVALILWLLALPPATHGQDPEILPGMPGDSLPAGELPLLTPPFLEDRDSSADFSAESTKTDAPKPRDYGVTGDWFGARSTLREDGISFKTNITQFYQGIAAGGLNETFHYGLKLDYFAVIEGEKLLGWEGFYVNLHGETRTGESINADVGALLAPDFALYFPQPNGTANALTNVQFQQYLTDDFVVTLGKINTPDGVNIHPFMGGYGTDRFMSMDRPASRRRSR